MTDPDPRPEDGRDVGRLRIEVRGTVQGVGFRPFAHQLATDLGLVGWVRNEGSSVAIEVEGPGVRLAEFQEVLVEGPPPLAEVVGLEAMPMEPVGEATFQVLASLRRDEPVEVAADVATCADCLAEVLDPDDRRHGYAFTNCTNCGPRFTIVDDVPYDRAATTMSAFAMCGACRAEYEDPTDRRFHAQPTCCADCGPSLVLYEPSPEAQTADDPIGRAATRLLAGEVLAVKGLGGYHLAVLADSEPAVALLRSRKHREEKPFAVMVPDLDAAHGLCRIGAVEEDLLTDPARPIVLLRRRPDCPIAEAVGPHTNEVGLMLPYTPLHHLLLRAVGRPLVLTSGNASDEPIAYRDDDARQRLAGIADAVLAHDRPIRTRTDDSVVRAVADRPMAIRRSRGYVPGSLRLPTPARRPILGVGAELKNTVALADGDRAVLSHHVGDLHHLENHRSFREAIDHLARLFRIEPRVVAHDLHPDYLSTAHATSLEGVDLVAVQHHHAHVAACLVDNGRTDEVIGVAFDGTGHGTDGTSWGGEFLVADLASSTRRGHLEVLPLPGGDAAMREPWRMAAVHLAHLGDPQADTPIRGRQPAWDDVVALAGSDLAGRTSSAGRLFDAVAALVGVRDRVEYEGQAAIEFEQRVDPTEAGAYPAGLTDDGALVLRGSDLFAAALDDLRAGTGVGRIAARFHHGLADAVVEACARIRADDGPEVVALTGGVFLNRVLLTRVVAGLEGLGFEVLRHRDVPPNDGGISLGQVAVAAALDRQ